MSTEWTQALTALVALYGAAVSTYNLIQQRRKYLPNLKVSLEIERCDKIIGMNQYGESEVKHDVSTVAVTILNEGLRSVMLDKFDLYINNAEKIDAPQVTRYYCGPEGRFQCDENFLQLPYDLLPDRKFCFRIHEEDIAKVLYEMGYSTIVELIGRFSDQTGKSYKSASYWFDLSKFSDTLNQ